MFIGILSDSHGRAVRVRHAVNLFKELGVDHIIHCGDVGGIGVFEELVGRSFSFVWGNTDEPNASLRAFLKTVDIAEPASVPLTLNLAGKQILVFHGHEPAFHSWPTSIATPDYIFHGHTHVQCDERVGQTRIINPGALHRASKHTVATLDLATDELTFHMIE